MTAELGYLCSVTVWVQNGPLGKCASYVAVHPAVEALFNDMPVVVVPEARVGETTHEEDATWACGPNFSPQLTA
jgi:hypothetical protein